MNKTTPILKLRSIGQTLDLSPQAFGELRRSDPLAQDSAGLRRRMADDGYLYLPGLLDPLQVRAARAYAVDRLAELGCLDERRPRDEAVSTSSLGKSFMPEELANQNRALLELLYGPTMMGFFERFLGGPVRHYDYTWFRSIPGGAQGTYPHCDFVFMGRGTFNLCTAWTPLGDIPRDLGGLLVLEGSHRKADRLRDYLQRDVDTYCTNRPDAPEIEAGLKKWQDWDGRLATNPVELREQLGGRWLTADFRIGDVLVFGMGTVHASLDNQTDRYRLSSDSRYQLASEPLDERWVGPAPIAHGPAGKKGRIC